MMVMSVGAQGLAQEPTTEFQSTSTMVGSGTTLSMAVESGAYTTYDVNASGMRSNKPGIRKDGENPFGDDTVGGTDNPQEPGTPIGDGMGVLALLAGAYLILRVVRRRERAKQMM